jgi:hypothetical protein
MPSSFITEQIIKELYTEASSSLRYFIDPYGEKNFLTAADGSFLGRIKDSYDLDSIFYRKGVYGHRRSPRSIFNRRGPYLKRGSPESMVDRSATRPPLVYINNQLAGRLTVNDAFPDAIPTDVFLFLCIKKCMVLDERLDDFIEIVSLLHESKKRAAFNLRWLKGSIRKYRWDI